MLLNEILESRPPQVTRRTLLFNSRLTYSSLPFSRRRSRDLFISHRCYHRLYCPFFRNTSFI